MNNQISAMESEYAAAGLGERILAALAEAGIGDDRLTPEALAPADQIHGGGLAATAEQAALIPLGPDTRVLDVGCGIGGPARYLAATFGCRVTGIDLSPDYIEAARLLTAKMGLGGGVNFECADATTPPFADQSFDVVWCQNVAMNIADRKGFYAGIRRVLAPGGLLTLTELCQGPAGAPDYPLPWARDPSVSFLVTPEATRGFLESAGFRIVEWRDTSAARAASDRARAAGKAPAPAADSPLAIEVTRGDDYGVRRANSSKAVLDGRLVNLHAVAERAA